MKFNREKAVKAIVKGLYKEFNDSIEKEKCFTIEPSHCRVFLSILSSKGDFYRFYDENRNEIFVPQYRGEEYADFMNEIKDAFWKKIEKKAKGLGVHWETEDIQSSGSWWSRSTCHAFKKVHFYKPCKDFKKLTKRLEQLGADTVNLGWRWRTDGVGGKRDWYTVGYTHNHATDEKKVNEALEALKGLKKATISIKEIDNLEDREYGIRYETEWTGSIDYCLEIVSSKGRVLI